MLSRPVRSGNSGFSLVELMIVVAIIGLLAALAVPRFQSFQAKARQSEAKNNLSHIYTLAQSYYGEHDDFRAATLNDLGFVVQGGGTGSKGGRYNYAWTPGDSTFLASATAKKSIVPGCTLLDGWSIDQTKDLKPTLDSVAQCK